MCWHEFIKGSEKTLNSEAGANIFYLAVHGSRAQALVFGHV